MLDTGRHLDQERRVVAHYRQVHQIAPVDHAARTDHTGVEHGCLGGDGDGLGDGSEFELHVDFETPADR
ncbi:hypothetical protein D3C83_279300 [compost metagenome]